VYPKGGKLGADERGQIGLRRRARELGVGGHEGKRFYGEGNVIVDQVVGAGAAGEWVEVACG
jgi:hypothetical protein